MRPRDYIPLALLVGIAAFVVVQGTRARRDSPRRRAAGDSSAVSTQGAGTEAAPATVSAPPTPEVSSPGLVEVRESAAPPPPRDPAALQELIRAGAPGTYMLNMIAEQKNVVMRWPERRMNALRVWIDRYPGLPDFHPSYPVVVEQVFDEWTQAGFSLRFDFVSDAAKAEIRIRWIGSLPESEVARIGTTEKTRDQNGWIVAADITISTHDRKSGKPFPPELVAGIARHEVGHALGLGHSDNKTDVMFPESMTPVISRADRATLHLLYILPPGLVQ